MKNVLRGKIYSLYPNVTSFAKAINWDRKKASRIVNGRQKPTVKDIEEMAKLFNVRDASDFVSIFFDELTTKRTETVVNPLDYFATAKRG